MGCQSSRHDDRQPLLADVDEEPILEKLTILLIGHHGAGKNTVGNAILCKNAFKYKHTYTGCYCKKENTIFGRIVTLIRVPGWSEDLSSVKNKEHFRVIKDSVLSVDGGPHMLILVGSSNTELTKTTKKLKEILGASVDKHILPLSVDAKLIVIKHRDERKTIIDRCRFPFFRCRCKNQSRKLLETIENFILHKDEIRFYHTGRRAPTPESKYQDLKNLVEGLCSHITTLEANAAENEAKIQELQRLLKEKDEMLRAKENKIKMLTANSSDTHHLHEKIDQLNQQRNQDQRELKELKEENEALKNENENLKRNKTPTTAVLRKETPNHVVITHPKSAETSHNEDPQSEKSHSQEFLKKYRRKLIDKVVSVQPIADQLLPFIGDYKYSLIQQASTRYDKMRQIFDIVNGGKKLQDEFYRSLQKEEKYLLEDLQSSND